MSVLLIGGCGFIGTHVANALVAKGIPIVIYDRNTNRANGSALVRYIKGEFGNRGELENVLTAYSITTVLHLVSSTLPESSNEDPEFDVSSNVCETIALLQLCVKHSIRKIVYLSSGGTVYGRPHYSPIDETHPTEPICSYGITKLTIEKYLALYHHLYGLKYTAIRAANPYGAGQNPLSAQGIISIFIRQMLHGQPLNVWGDGNIVRDFFHVHDLANLCCRVLDNDYCGIINAGSGKGLTINQLIVKLSDTLKITPVVVRQDRRDFDVAEIVLNCNLAQRLLGWTPTVPFEEGVKGLASWIKTNYS